MRTMTAFDEDLHAGKDTDLTLGMPSLLGIFFGIVLICGVFFGFGYSLGRRNLPTHSNSEAPAQTPDSTPAQIRQPAQPKPAAETVLQEDAQTDASSPSAERRAQPSDQLTPPASRPVPQVLTKAAPAHPQPETPHAAPSAARPDAGLPLQPAVRPAAAPAGIVPAGSIMVQIAAVSRRDDAIALVTAVRKDGFNATLRSEPQDKLLHVQIGPFASREEARAMRQKLANAGYNAFIK